MEGVHTIREELKQIRRREKKWIRAWLAHTQLSAPCCIVHACMHACSMHKAESAIFGGFFLPISYADSSCIRIKIFLLPNSSKITMFFKNPIN
jgi:hypothetical protein